MKSFMFKLSFICFAFMAISFLSSCNKDEETTTEELDEYTEEVVFRTQESLNMGRFGCYELVFPVNILFPDATTVSVESYEAFGEAVKAWRKDNPRVKARPSIEFPFSIINDEGEIIVVESREDQMKLKALCARDFFNNHGPLGHNGRPKLCFRLTLPYSVLIPDGTVINVQTVADIRVLHQAVATWRRANPNSLEHSTLVYPVTAKLEDGSLVVIASKEELKALKDSCN